MTKESKARCMKCNKKLGVMIYICKCEKQFCVSHLQAEEHQCTYDYKIDGKDKMKKVKTTRFDVSEHLRTPEEMAAYLEACFEEATR
jgi:hypothetical protein